MTIVGDWIRKTLEKSLGRFEEGQRPPPRLREQVIAFANAHPHATRAEWTEFAASFVEECYLAGYIRGVEHAEREEWPPKDAATPEELATVMDPGWEDRPWRPGIALTGHGGEEVPETRTPEQVMADQVEAMKAKARTL